MRLKLAQTVLCMQKQVIEIAGDLNILVMCINDS